MPQSVLEMAKDLVMAQIQTKALLPEEMHHALQQTYASLVALKTKEETGVLGPVEIPATAPNWKQNITKHTVTCLECGATFKQLSVRHLKEHDLDARSYRVKYGIPRTQPLSAKDTTAMRKKIVEASRPWEKAPTFLKAQEAKAEKTPGTRKKGARKKAAKE